MSNERLKDCVNYMIQAGWHYTCCWMYHNDIVKPRDVRRAIAMLCTPKNYWEGEQIMKAMRREKNNETS